MSEKPQAAPEPQEAAPAPASAQAQAKDYYDQLIRLKAEFENFRKRTDREKPELFRLGRAEVIFKLFPIFDLLQKAHNEIQSSHAQSPLAKGMEGIFKEFEKIFKEEGVVKMDPLGKPYDPLQHEVLGAVLKEGFVEGHVAEVLQDGFLMLDKVLRTAKVRIANKGE